jgi:hypothetical protein
MHIKARGVERAEDRLGARHFGGGAMRGHEKRIRFQPASFSFFTADAAAL